MASDFEEVGLSVPIDATDAKRGADEISQALDSIGTHAEGSVIRVRAALNTIEGSLLNVKNALLGLGFAATIKEIMGASVQFDRIQNSLLAVSGDAGLAMQSFREVREVAYRLGQDLPTVAAQFAKMSVAAQGSALQGTGVVKVMNAVLTAASALGMSQEKVRYSMLAVEQMISKGAVSMQELRRQLGDNLPGAFNIASKAMGVTTTDMVKLVRSGKLMTEDFLPKFADALENRFGKAAEIAANKTQGLINKLTTAFFEFRIFLAQNGLGQAFNDLILKATAALRSDELKSAAKEIGSALAEGLTAAGKAAMFLAQHASTVLHVFEAYLGLKIAIFLGDLAVRIRDVAKAMMELAVVQKGLNLLSGLNPFGAAAAGGEQAAAAATMTGMSRFMTKNGKLLNKSQYAMREASGAFGDVGQAQKEFDVLKTLYGKSSQLLSQQQLNARLAGEAFESMSFKTKLLSRSMAEQVGLQISLGTILKTTANAWLSNAKAAGLTVVEFARLSFSNPAAAFGMLSKGMTAAETATDGVVNSVGNFLLIIPRLIASGLGMIPVWGWIALAIGAAVTAAYYFRDSLISIDGHKFTIADSIGGVMDLVKEELHTGLMFIKDWIRDLDAGISYGLSLIVAKAKEWKTPIEDAFKAMLVGVAPELAAIAKMLEIFSQSHKNESKETVAAMLHSTQQHLGIPDPAGNLKYQGGTKPVPRTTPTDDKVDRVKETIAKLKEEKKYTDAVSAANLEYAGSTSATELALARLNAARLAEEKIISLHGKATEQQRSQIRSLYLEIEIAKMITDKFTATINKETLAAGLSLTQHKFLLQAFRQGTAAYEDEVLQQQVDNYERSLGVALTKEQVIARDALVATKKEDLEVQRQLARETSAKALAESVNPLRALRTELEKIAILKNTGLINKDEMSVVFYDMEEKYNDAVNKMLRKSKDWKDGAIAALREYAQEASKTANLTADMFKSMLGDLESSVTKFLDTTKFGFKEFLQSLRHDLDAVVAKQLVGKLALAVLGPKYGSAFQPAPKGTEGDPIFVKSVGGGLFGGGGIGGGVSGNDDEDSGDGETGTGTFGGFFKKIGTGFKSVITKIGSWFKTAFKGIGGFLKDAFSKGGEIFKAIGSGLMSALKWMGGLFHFAEGGVMSSQGMLPLNRYAGGGIATRPQLAMFGEGRWPEAFVPLPNGRSIPVHFTSGSSGGSTSINVTHDGSTAIQVVRHSDREIEVIAKRVVHKETPALYASHLSDANSRISKSTSRNINASRRR